MFIIMTSDVHNVCIETILFRLELHDPFEFLSRTAVARESSENTRVIFYVRESGRDRRRKIRQLIAYSNDTYV